MSFIAELIIYKYIGEDIDKVAEAGTGLAFVTYPEALALLPLPWLWSILFFFMIFLLGLDTEFAAVETFLTTMYDAFPSFRKHKVNEKNIKLSFLSLDKQTNLVPLKLAKLYKRLLL